MTLHKTVLHDEHVGSGARMIDFAGWHMPLHYGSQLEEHRTVRKEAGMFDVSHMPVIDVSGPDARAYLGRLLANDVARLVPGQALYACMLRDDGGIIDDLLVYRLGQADGFRLVTNAARRDRDVPWMREVASGFEVTLRERDDTALLAVQGPQARERVHALLGESASSVEALEPFHAAEVGGWFIARTGYTGEDGYEIMLPADEAVAAWRQLRALGVSPIGLGARDTLRLEAGLPLYGQEMDESVTPLASGLGWTVAWDPPERDFIGRAALEAARGQVRETSRAIILQDRGVLRPGQAILQDGRLVGRVTSGSFSPVLERAIGLARVERGIPDDCRVEVRGRQLEARLAQAPLVRHGKGRTGLD